MTTRAYLRTGLKARSQLIHIKFLCTHSDYEGKFELSRSELVNGPKVLCSLVHSSKQACVITEAIYHCKMKKHTSHETKNTFGQPAKPLASRGGEERRHERRRGGAVHGHQRLHTEAGHLQRRPTDAETDRKSVV